ncbi:FAD-dependent oxidoreductase [Aquipuribacter sp. SD81]|uniref:FAD-dependent oxidoreductase n=1 Tax=Aquipuribacter sp. SD81 TaxID=3127703 RepID=UPI0030181079
MDPDVVVVGGGAAGLSAATTVAAAGSSVVLVSEGPLGGDCTWHGCVPTKALLEAAAAGLDAAGALEHAARCVTRLARLESAAVLEAAGVVVRSARVVVRQGPTGPVVDAVAGGGGDAVPAGGWSPRLGVVLATGSRPVTTVPGVPPLGDLPAGARVATTDGWQDALAAHLASAGPDGGPGSGRRIGPRVPGPVVVVGGGASGVELAQALARLGLPVTLLERAATVLPGLPGAGDAVAAALALDGVRVVVDADETDVRGAVGPGTLVLLAAGRVPAVDCLSGWDGPPVTGPAGVVVDAAMRTAAPGLVAAGDVTGLLPTTHVAAATGRVAAATLLGRTASFDARWAPRVAWCEPGVAAVGDLDGPRHVRVPLSRVDRAVLAAVPGSPRRPTAGSVQVWADEDGRLRGALAVCPRAGDIVSEAALAGRLGLTVEQWAGGAAGVGVTSADHAYPSWSWAWREALDRLLGR